MGNNVLKSNASDGRSSQKSDSSLQAKQKRVLAWRSAFNARRQAGIMQDFWNPPDELELDLDTVDDLVPINTGYRMPRGHFGLLPLVKAKQNGKYYRMKTHSKKLMKLSRLPKTNRKVLVELQILANCNCVFIPKLRGYFIDQNNIYVMLDDYECGDLQSSVIRVSKAGAKEIRLLTETEVVFIGAQIISAIHYLHSINIIHRDIKTQNVVIRRNGYCALIDFGFAKFMESATRAYSVLGTWEFMAPEILRGEPYSYCVDFWGFGCILHQLIAGCPPYKKTVGGPNKYHFKYTNLLPRSTGPLRRPKDSSRRGRHEVYNWEEFQDDLFEEQTRVSKPMADLLSRIFRMDPYKRLGSCVLSERRVERMCRGAQDIMEHSWFHNTDFDQLYGQTIPAPWQPQFRTYSSFLESDWTVVDIVTHKDPNTESQAAFLRSTALEADRVHGSPRCNPTITDKEVKNSFRTQKLMP